MDCSTLLSCLRVHIDYGFTIPPIFNDGFPGPIPFEYEPFNFIYILFINLIVTAIISGIIIDTFAQMRQDAEKIADDSKNLCFICNIERERFEMNGINF